MSLTQKQINILRNDFKIAKHNAKSFEKQEGKEVLAGYWVGRLEQIRNINILIGITEK